MENSPVTMENEDTFVFSLLTVAAIDTVVWTVVPLAGEHIQAFCNTARNMIGLKWMINNWANSIRTLYTQTFVYLMNVQNSSFSEASFVSYITFIMKIMLCL